MGPVTACTKTNVARCHCAPGSLVCPTTARTPRPKSRQLECLASHPCRKKNADPQCDIRRCWDFIMNKSFKKCCRASRTKSFGYILLTQTIDEAGVRKHRPWITPPYLLFPLFTRAPTKSKQAVVLAVSADAIKLLCGKEREEV